MPRAITLTVNGTSHRLSVRPAAVLLDVLRDELGLKGTKEGCGSGGCGACTVLLNGQAVYSCALLALEADGREITTIEGVATEGVLHPLQEAFVTSGAVQCGFCTPGLILSAKALLAETPAPTEAEVREAIVGNLCRCTGYVKVIEAVIEAAARSAEARA